MKKHLPFSILIIFYSITSSQIVLNEISNRGGLYDESGNECDWIEIYNAGEDSINILNYALSDEATNPMKWKFPDITLAPDETYLVLANGDGKINEINHWETAIFDADIWKYFVGESEPPLLWNSSGFDDEDWLEGAGGVGYGDFDDGTTISNTNSVYLRKTFTVSDTSDIASALLHLSYDDGFVAYLNGIEIMRSGNLIGTPPAYNENTSYDHEATLYAGYPPDAFMIDEEVLKTILVPGENTLSLQVHNLNYFSSDLSSNAWLSFGIKSSEIYFSSPPLWFSFTVPLNHTNFTINNDGETIYLSNSASEIIDMKNISGVEYANVLARIPDGDLWCTTDNATAGSSNNTAECFDGYEPAPVFNITSGFYDGEQTIEISSASPTAIIRYTTDGSLVRESSPVYSSAIIIDTSSIISAKCFSSTNKFPSVIKKSTYFIDEPDYSLPVISISADPGSFFDIDTGIYVFGRPDWDPNYPYFGSNFWEDWQRLAYITYFDESKTEQFSKQMYIQIHGGWSRAENQRSFRIDFKNELDGDLHYQLFPDDKPEVVDFNNFNLRNSGQHVAATRLQDAWCARMMKDSHLDYEAYYPCVVFINGEYWGLYEIREKADEYFAESNYGVDPDKVDLRNGWTQLAGSDTSFTNLYAWVMANDPADTEFYYGLSSKIDLENYADYYIAEIFWQNVDFGGAYWGINNIKLWKENSSEGRWRHIMYDMDGALGYFGENIYTNYIDLIRNPSGGASANSLMFDRILMNEQFRNYFSNRFADLMNTIYLSEHAEAVLDSIQSKIEPEMDRQISRWALPYSYDYWLSTIDDMINYHESRISPARGNIKASFDFDAVRDIDLDVYPSGAGHIKISTIYPDPLPWNGKYFEGCPVLITAIPNPGYTFNHWQPNDIIPAGDINQTLEINLTSSETFIAQFDGSPVSPSVLLTEINYHSAESMNSGEWIEIYNAGADKLDISGWKLFDNNELPYYEIPLGTVLESNSYLLLTEDPAKFTTMYPALENTLGGFPFSFANSGDRIILKDLDNNTIFSVAYTDSLNWPKGADGTGRTLELKSYTGDLNDPDNWFDGCMFGSPGEAYSPCSDPLVFGEINYNSAADLDAGDWIELWNNSGMSIDMSYWKFADDKDTLIYQFPDGTILNADERIVVANNLTLFSERHPEILNYAGPFLFGLDGAGEEMRLFDENGLIQFSIIYDDVLPWPEDADGGGKTLELLNASGNMNEASNWFAGCWEGSPGEAYNPDCTNQIEELSVAEISVYPNPASDDFYISLLMESGNTPHATLQLINTEGTIVFQKQNINENIFRIERKDLPAGVYYIKIIADGNMIVKKIILI